MQYKNNELDKGPITCYRYPSLKDAFVEAPRNHLQDFQLSRAQAENVQLENWIILLNSSMSRFAETWT